MVPAVTISNARQVSWRDPSGHVVIQDGRVFRAVAPHVATRLGAILDSAWYGELVSSGSVVASDMLERPPPGIEGGERWTWIEHPRLGFPTYPHEITPLQLWDAGILTL